MNQSARCTQNTGGRVRNISTVARTCTGPAVNNGTGAQLATMTNQTGRLQWLTALDIHVCFVRLHNHHALALGNLVALCLQPGDNLALGHGGRKGWHEDFLYSIPGGHSDPLSPAHSACAEGLGPCQRRPSLALQALQAGLHVDLHGRGDRGAGLDAQGDPDLSKGLRDGWRASNTLA